MPPPSDVSELAAVNPLLSEERARATFSVLEMTYLLDGSQDLTKRRHHVEQLAGEDPDFDHAPIEFLSREQQYELAVRKAILCQHKLKEHGLEDDVRDSYLYKRMVMHHENSPIGLHWIMFVPTLMSQSTPEQQERWLTRAENYNIIGTYAQTEMGHGTYLRGIETTATYDPATQEFELHSPTVSATKWWPGNLGKSTNYAVVMAQLYTLGVCHGPHFFMLQLRDEDTHASRPGITLGDIGPKFGYNTNDNGFMKLTHVRLPRDHMLARHAQVLPNGEYVAAKRGSKLSYGTMVLVRSLIAGDVARALAECATIAVRYSAVRRQGEPLAATGLEPRLLDYPTQRAKLLPNVAAAYALWFAGEDMREQYFEVQTELFDGRDERLPELHANSAGLKAYSSASMAAGAEQLRMACGGHGYSMAAGFAKIYTDMVPACTYEGDNTVMLLQTARYLLKAAEMARLPDAALPPSVAYLRPSVGTSELLAPECMQSLLAAYEQCARSLLQSAAVKFQSQSGAGFRAAFEAVSVRLPRVALAHCQLQVVVGFLRRVAEAPAELQPVLRQLCRLHMLHGIVTQSGDFLGAGAVSIAGIALCQEAYEAALEQLAPQAVALVDAFDFPDRVLGSVLGRYDGQVYENLFKWAQQSPLNQTDVHDSFHKYIRPLMRGERPEGMKARL